MCVCVHVCIHILCEFMCSISMPKCWRICTHAAWITRTHTENSNVVQWLWFTIVISQWPCKPMGWLLKAWLAVCCQACHSAMTGGLLPGMSFCHDMSGAANWDHQRCWWHPLIHPWQHHRLAAKHATSLVGSLNQRQICHQHQLQEAVSHLHSEATIK